jgi:TonB family protein
VEITWPETRRLKHCIGRSVDVRILVGENGAAQKVEASGGGMDADCLDAALEAARRIKFEPGRVGGKASAMWTQVRIDFERKK